MTFEPWHRECALALGAVRDGAVLARHLQQEIGGEAFLKPDRSPVTVADLAVQALIARRLADEFPADPLVAEEDSASLRSPAARPVLLAVTDAVRRVWPSVSSDQVLNAIGRGAGSPGERFWSLDPIDGTKGFVRGDQYVVALALVVRGRIEIGMLGCPRLPLNAVERAAGSVVFAVRDQGAFSVPLMGGDPTPLRVSASSEPRTARVLRSYEDQHMDLETFNEILASLGVGILPTLMDSQAKHAVLAAGGADLLLRLPARQGFRDKIWDQAAGTLIIEEAGGRVTDLRGDRLDFGAGRTLARNEGLIASNRGLHSAVLEAIASLHRRAPLGRVRRQI